MRKQVSKLQQKIQETLHQNEEVVQDLLANQPAPAVQTLKDSSHKEFSTEVKKTTIALIALQISAENCPLVIQTVGKYLFNVDISKEDLPSDRTVRRYADQGHVLAKVQVAEAVSAGNFDIHTDGTSRDKKKWIGYQIKTAEESLCCGFTTVATENASTLVETTLMLLQELSEVYSEGDRQEHFKQILRNLAGVMTDRAAVMKKFKKDLNEAVQTTLETEESIEFLECNAHFLLGLSAKTNAACKDIQLERGENRIGRDRQPRFQKFTTSEAAVVRYIRMACEVLGPRGDEKNGCRDGWIAFCSLSRKRSVISSFKGNRFNNLFEAAAALNFHRADIITYLQEYLPERNGKLESVLSDALCDQLAHYVLALALLFFRVTGPYWELLGSGVLYLDFFLHVVAMKQQLQEWSDDASTIFNPELPALFGRQQPHCAPFEAAVQVEDTSRQAVNKIVQSLCGQLLTVLDAQLKDFLPGGMYHAVDDPMKRNKLAHSHITNLLGEACFGDLDLSIYKRRNASCHHHATMNMLVRNRTMSKWFHNKPKPEQEQLLKLSATKGQELRERHQQDERDVVSQKKLVLEQNKRRYDEKKVAQVGKINNISISLQQHGGPCQTPEHVDQLISRFNLQKDRRSALHLQMHYYKTVLGLRSPLLKTSIFSVVRLTDNLKNYLRQRGRSAGEPFY